ncbi:MAG: Hsp70 family protein [Thermodesulfatator sp.]|nr:MAG: Hsp70 family protein [Thermodesulfatator sp.]
MKEPRSRFVVGIDLGTTNSVLSYIDTSQKPEGSQPQEIQIFLCPQIEAPGEVKEHRLLPSFIYLPTQQEREGGGLVMPWDPFGERVVGKWARVRGAEVPGRLVSSAKSWLCHRGVDRTAPILPLDAAPDCQKISPVVATATYLRHFKSAWNYGLGKKAGEMLEDQDVYITIPASFDAVARDLTVKAAASAGLADVVLLEEPQAAFYAWLHRQGEEWKKQVEPGDVILVVDVGGGTSDFSLIQVSAQDNQLMLERLAVGEHLLLGGDNIDLTLTWHLAEALKAKGQKLDQHQFQSLWNNVRLAKEKLLEDPDLESVPVIVPGRGSGLIGGTIRTELTRQQVVDIILEGFFPKCAITDMPVERQKAGLQELGLPYAEDTAITRHLAKFLTSEAASSGRAEEGPVIPSAVLFNGGVFKAQVLRDRIMAVIKSWAEGRAEEPVELLGTDLDLAVSRGAAHFGMVQLGEGIKIRGGVPRSYYIGLESATLAIPGMPPRIKALCVVPKGLEEGTVVDIPEKEFGLVVGQEVEFKFLGSNERPEDKPGDIIDDWEDTIEPVSTLRTELEAPGIEPGTIIPVTLQARVTEVGTLAISLVSKDKDLKFDLEFDVRN